MTPDGFVDKHMRQGRTDRSDVLRRLRETVGPAIPGCRRVDQETVRFDWVRGATPAGAQDLSPSSLRSLGTLLRDLHDSGRRERPDWGVVALDELPDTARALDTVAARLQLPRAGSAAARAWSLTWVHGDVAPDNMVLRPDTGHVRALIDWEFLAWDFAVLDLAHALWKTVPWDAAVLDAERSTYEVLGGRTAALLAGYGSAHDPDELVLAQAFLMERRLIAIAAGSDGPHEDPGPRWQAAAEQARRDLDALLRDPARYRRLVPTAP